jgi:ATP-dependent helicase HrpB
MTRLRTVPASRASADQRAGRAGRLGPGVAWRLWSQMEHAARRPFTEPEILRVELAGLALELEQWGGDPSTLPWLDPPPKRALDDARQLLDQLGLLGTDAGRRASRLPVHPRLARMVIDAPTWTACVLATVLDGRPPPGDAADITLRLGRFDERRARDLARRADILPGALDVDEAGRLLALAYPDRIGQARGGPGRFRLRGGAAAWVPADDPLARAPFVVAADLDGKRDGARIRLGAAVDLADVLVVAGGAIREHRSIAWDKERGDVVERIARTLDRLDLGTVVQRPTPGAAATAALLEHARRSRLRDIPLDRDQLRARVALLGLRDVRDTTLVKTVDEWLAPYLAGATSVADLAALDPATMLLDPPQQAELERRAPLRWRGFPIDYGADGGPTVSVRVQRLFGVTEHPTIDDGRLPLVVELLSPADRPVQVTSDLPGFWSGSWHEVRKAMAGRYPKHAWPEDPTGYAAPP